MLTVATGRVAPAAGAPVRPGAGHAERRPGRRVRRVIADPEGLVAQRFGLKNGGRVVIRPDGYIGAVAALDDTTTVADYFAKIGS